MKFCLFVSFTMMLVSLETATAQADTAHHRAIYSEINAAEKTYQKVTGIRQDEPLEQHLTGWLKDGEVKKIVVRTQEDGEGYEEYYLEGEKLLFVFSTYKTEASNKASKQIENRLYFKDGSIFKWLTNDKATGVMRAEDYEGETERLISNSSVFIAVLKGKGSQKVAKLSLVADGVFTGIEEGDYFHWNMSSQGKDLSFFILNPDAAIEKVLANPKSFAGKKCRVTWKKSTENIPEAGGQIEIDQILSVEWLTAK